MNRTATVAGLCQKLLTGRARTGRSPLATQGNPTGMLVWQMPADHVLQHSIQARRMGSATGALAPGRPF